jgi:prephenate dehydratase
MSNLRVAIQGLPGSFHDAAARSFFGEDITIIPCGHFEEALAKLHSERVERTVIAVENSSSGTVVKSIEALRKSHYWISGEIVLRVEHCLIGITGSSLGTIHEVHSQAPALDQCEHYLDTTLPDAVRVEQHDTTASVLMVKDWDDITKAAIASRHAAELHNMKIIAAAIQDQKNNYTRFLVLEKKRPAQPTGNKTSLILETSHQPGALYSALGIFAKSDINLSKLESHHIPHKPFVYRFYVDIEAGLQEPHCEAALDQLRALGCDVTVLGTYQRATTHMD